MARTEPRPRQAPRGFTFIEILVVVIIVGLLAYIAFPRYHDLKRQALAGRAAADYHAVKLAAYAFHTQNRTWPAEAATGVVPPELTRDLPQGFDFHRGEYVLDWENWQLPNGMPQFPARHMLMALSISTTDSILALSILKKLGNQVPHFQLGNTLTFVMVEQ